MASSVATVVRLSLLYLTFTVAVIRPEDVDVLVEIPQGPLKGSVMRSSENKEFLAFRGIPYALPPVGDLRFSDPLPAKPWQGILDATKEAPSCLQYVMLTKSVIGQEDCLFLNVYTREKKVSELKPVLVWIHGGAWIEGSGNGETYMYGPEYLMNEDVVLVTINYRLAMFGFLSTEDEDAPGNYGLLDQTLALQWIHDNIAKFGGDPEKVTIFGESAGGGSVHYMMITPRTKGLFQRAVSQSGTALCPWATIHDARDNAFALGKAFNCDTTNSKALLECLKTIDGVEFLRRSDIFKKYIGLVPLLFGPRVDRERKEPLIPDEPRILLEQGRYNPVPWITGVTKDEGAFFTASLVVDNELQKLTDEPDMYLPYLLNYYQESSQAASITQHVLRYYFDNEKITEKRLPELVEVISDTFFNRGLVDAVELHTQGNLHPVYVYVFAHRFKFSLVNLTGFKATDLGVGHADDLLGLFRGPFSPSLSNEDEKVSKMLIKHLVNFAITGDPNGNSSSNKGAWLPFNEKKGYLDISLHPKFVTGKFAFEDRLDFWKHVTSFKDEL